MTRWLIDKSALVRLAASPDTAGWFMRIKRGLVRITTVTRLETKVVRVPPRPPCSISDQPMTRDG
jgi:hypothetical protein